MILYSFSTTYLLDSHSEWKEESVLDFFVFKTLRRRWGIKKIINLC